MKTEQASELLKQFEESAQKRHYFLGDSAIIGCYRALIRNILIGEASPIMTANILKSFISDWSSDIDTVPVSPSQDLAKTTRK